MVSELRSLSELICSGVDAIWSRLRSVVHPFLSSLLFRGLFSKCRFISYWPTSPSCLSTHPLITFFPTGVRLKLAECTIDEVGALLKNLLRSVPGGILLSILYTEFVATNDFKDIPTRVQQIHK